VLFLEGGILRFFLRDFTVSDNFSQNSFCSGNIYT